MLVDYNRTIEYSTHLVSYSSSAYCIGRIAWAESKFLRYRLVVSAGHLVINFTREGYLTFYWGILYFYPHAHSEVLLKIKILHAKMIGSIYRFTS